MFIKGNTISNIKVKTLIVENEKLKLKSLKEEFAFIKECL